MTGTEDNESAKLKKPNADLPRINLRPFLFIALGLVFGIILYTRIRFGGAKGTDFVFSRYFLPFPFVRCRSNGWGRFFYAFSLPRARVRA